MLAHCLSRRLATEDLSSFRDLLQISWPRLCIILVFFDSWLFLLASGVLIFGVGLEYRYSVCSAAIYLCIGCYTGSKLLIYLFLSEKVHIVWSPLPGTKRFHSRIYIVCFATLCVYFVVILLMIFGRIHYFREDGTCVVGLRHLSSYPLLIFDLFINIFLTGLFVWPLLKSRFLNPSLRRVASRTLIGAAAALTSSTTNIAILGTLHGEELGWICLGSCGADVIFNALALFWVTKGPFHDSDNVATLVSAPLNQLRYGFESKIGPLLAESPLAQSPAKTRDQFNTFDDSQNTSDRQARRLSVQYSTSMPDRPEPATTCLSQKSTPILRSFTNSSCRDRCSDV